VADGDLEETRLHVQELVDRTGLHGGDEYRDLGGVVRDALLQPRLDACCVAVERLALGLHELGEHGPDAVHGVILVVPAKMDLC